MTNPKFEEHKKEMKKMDRMVNPKFIIVCNEPSGLTSAWPFVGDLGGEEGFDLDTVVRVTKKKEARFFNSAREASDAIEKIKTLSDRGISKMHLSIIAEYFVREDDE